MTGRRALVTGASGFVGGHLVRGLLDAGWRVRCLVRPTSRLDGLPRDRVELVEGALDRPDTLAPAAADVDTVFHSAAALFVGDLATYTRVNVEGTRALARALVEASPGHRRFVLVSSLAAAGPSRPGDPRTEADPPDPKGPYGVSKRGSEEVLGEVPGLRWAVARPPMVYGPRDTGFLRLYRMVARGAAVRVDGPLQQLSAIHVDDLVTGLLAVAEADAAEARAYFLTHPEILTWPDIGQAVAAGLGKRYREIVLPRGLVPPVSKLAGVAARLVGRPNPFPPDRVEDLFQPAWTCSAGEAERDLGFRARVEAARGFRETVRWYVKEGWL